jgi:hypothetical protein
MAMVYLSMAVCYTSDMERYNTFVVHNHSGTVVKAHNNFPGKPSTPKFHRIFKTVVKNEKSFNGPIAVAVVRRVAGMIPITGYSIKPAYKPCTAKTFSFTCLAVLRI